MPQPSNLSRTRLMGRFLGRATKYFLAILAGGLAATATFAQQTAVFTLVDNTNLPLGQYKIFVTGYSTPGALALQQDGSWAPAATPTGGATLTLPCYQVGNGPGQISQVQINGTQTTISARVYYFIVTDLTQFPNCNPTGGNTGLFNQVSGFTYTSTAPLNIAAPPATAVTGKTFPAWTFSEIGASASNGTIDLSQVDFLSFPMNTTASVKPGTPPNPTVIGNPVGTDNPNDVVNALSIPGSYQAFVNTAGAGAAPYLDLLQNVTTANSIATQSIIHNPGGYLGQSTTTTKASALNTVFDAVINKLWTTTSPPTLVLRTGGTLGSVPDDVFTSAITTLTLSGFGNYPIIAMQFTGATTGYVAYVFSPRSMQDGCNATTAPIIPSQYCSNPTSTGYQVFAGDGALGAPRADTYTQLASVLPAATTSQGAASYQQVVTRLGFLISGAMNRGVALATCPGATWTCWQNETYWYPTTVSATFPDITQNLFAYWMHTAIIGGTPMFKRPPSAVQSASGTPGGGLLMGMAYGFSNDENPTPQVTIPPQPEVPSKLDQTVVYGGPGPYSITFGPWVTSVLTPTLVVSVQGTGTVTSSPAGITCGTACSQAFAQGTSVTLTATPGANAIFSGWSGACSGASTTCAVNVNATTTVNAVFTTAPPSTFGLNVVVSGSGSVNSVPAGINCGTACSSAFPANAIVTLTASSSGGWTFAGWSGACSGVSPTCAVTMSQARNVGAAFTTSAQYTLTVIGASGGIVTSTPGSIDCGTRCIAAFPAGTIVNVIARPDPGFVFTGWTGACTGTNTCDVTMNSSQTVQATFAPVAPGQFALTVHDYGNGTIVSTPFGIQCGIVCSAVYAAGTPVTLTASPAAGTQFAGWSGACSGTGPCTVVMSNNVFVNATFVSNAVPTAMDVPTLTEGALLLLTLLLMGAGWREMKNARVSRRDH